MCVCIHVHGVPVECQTDLYLCLVGVTLSFHRQASSEEVHSTGPLAMHLYSQIQLSSVDSTLASTW